MGRGTANGTEVGVAVSWFRITGDLKLPDTQVTFWDLFPSYFAVLKLEVRTQDLGLMANQTGWYGPLN